MGIEHPKQLSESNMPPQVLRRMNLLDDMFTNIRSRYADRVCDYRHPKYLLSLLIERTMEDFYYAWVSEIVSDDEWDAVSPKLEKYLYDKYRDSTTRYWENECNKKSSFSGEEVTEYSRTLKNARQQGSGLRFPKSAIKANPSRFRPYNR
jgi:hypothetical protein